jgi:predicted site-specific integrase-resolvase
MQGAQRPRPEIKMHRISGASEKSGLSRSTLYNRIRDGSLQTVKVYGVRLIPDEALRRLLQMKEDTDA